jgi:hypothetical protein
MQKIGFVKALDSIVATDNRYSREAYVFLRDAQVFAQVKFPFWIRAECRTHHSLQRSESKALNAVIRVYDDAGNVIETHEKAGEFEEW